MPQFKVTLVKKIIHRAEITVTHDNRDFDEVADKAWETFNKHGCEGNPEYDYSTIVKEEVS